MAGVITRMRAATKAVAGIFSEDSARQAYGLLSGIFPGGAGTPPTRGTLEHLRAYKQHPWLRATAGRVATKTATTTWELYATRKPGSDRAYRPVAVQRAFGAERRKRLKALTGSGEATRVEAHPVLDLLNDPNSFQTGHAMRKVTQLHIDLAGEAFWLKERDGLGLVVGLWPIPPNWVANTPTPANRNFRVSFRGWRGLVPDTEFIWFADPDPENPYGRGSGTAQSLTDELETDEYAAKHTKAFFYNSAKPDFVVWPKVGSMNEGNVARAEEDWLSRSRGFWRAFKPYFLSREVGIHEFAQNFRNQQLVPLREYERDTIIQTFGLPPEMLGVLQNANRATITAADLIMSRYVVEPRLEFQRSVMQERLVPEFDERLVLEYVSPVQDDKDFQLDAGKAAPYSMSVDEWRELQGLGPHEDARVGRMVPVPTTVALKSVEALVEPPQPPPPQLVPPGGEPPEPEPPPPPEQKPPGEDGDLMDDAGKPPDQRAFEEWLRLASAALKDGDGG